MEDRRTEILEKIVETYNHFFSELLDIANRRPDRTVRLTAELLKHMIGITDETKVHNDRSKREDKSNKERSSQDV